MTTATIEKYDIEIADFNSSGIRSGAAQIGATRMRLIGCGQYDGRDGSDNQVCFYAIQNPAGGEELVANTNGDPVWRESDEAAFEKLAAYCGVWECAGREIGPDTELVAMTCDGTDEDLVGSFLGSMSAREYAQTQEEAERHGVPCAAIIEMCEQYLRDGSVWFDGDDAPDDEIYSPGAHLSEETFTPREVHEAIMAGDISNQ